jgi:nitrous oxidase accessory protein NosD
MNGVVVANRLRVTCLALALLVAAIPLSRSSDDAPSLTGTPISGNITGNVTWTTAGNPYWIVGEVQIDPGAVLRIDPGVRVQFNGANLTVLGRLEATGIVAERIVFTTNLTPPSVWGNVLVTSGGSALLRNATLEYGGLSALQSGEVILDRFSYTPPGASAALVIESANGFLLANSTIRANAGVEVRDTSRALISDTIITGPGLGPEGLDVSNSPDAVTRGNRIRGFTHGIRVSGMSPQIVGNDVAEATYGLFIDASDALIVDNRVHESLVGILLNGAPRSIVRSNLVYDNAAAGLDVSGVQSAQVSGNAFVGNGHAYPQIGYGVRLDSSSWASVHDNTVQGNRKGIWLDGGQGHRVHHNWILWNVEQAVDTSLGSWWDDWYPSGGNHWSDYVGNDVYRGPNQDIPGPDGIGDASRPIPPNVAADRYPFYSVAAPGPPPFVTAKAVGDDILLSWQAASMADSYMVHTANDPTEFDFSSPVAVGNVTSWTDVGAAAFPGERYYIVRGHNVSLNRTGPTSNTAGKWTYTFPPGSATLALPLAPYPWVNYSEPGWIDTASDFVAATGAIEFAYMEGGRWRTIPADGDPGRTLRTGDGYLASFPTPARFTFTGLPGTVIDHAGWPPYPERGFDPTTTARGISAQVQGNDVIVEWPRLPDFGPPNGSYLVYASRTRAGLRGYPGLDHVLLATVAASASPRLSYVHNDALLASPEWYYFVVPVREVYWRGSSTYSVGVSAFFLPNGPTAIGLPLRPYENGTYGAISVSGLVGPEVRGIVWFDPDRQDWVAHAAWMPVGTHDVVFLPVMAVQVDVATPTRIVFVGV